jgi:hypothetical protein
MPPKPSGRLRIRTQVGSEVLAMATAGSELAAQAPEFASARILQGLTGINGVFHRVVYGLGRRAGRAFPMIYRDHLYLYMRSQPIAIQLLGPGRASVALELSLGSWDDYERGFHHNALIETDYASIGIKGSPKKKEFFERHPPKVGFPPGFEGQSLMNTPARRAEWWESAIIGRNPETKVKQGTGQFLADIPTYEEVAEARLHNAWMLTGKAPQWLILEYGTHAGTEPYCPPLHFSDAISVASTCLANRVYDAAIRTVDEMAIAKGRVRTGVNVRGKAFVKEGSTGRFTGFLDRLESNIGDTDICFGGLL